MVKRSLVLVLSCAALAGAAFSQEIVIEPTNGRAQYGKVKVTRPANAETGTAKDTSAPKEVAKPAPAAHIVTKAPAKKPALKTASVTKPKPVVETPPAAEPEPAKTEAAAPAPAPKKSVPARPAWAMRDSRDPHAVQSEIANAIARDPKLSTSSIKVNVDDASVTLEGQASSTEERLQAQRLAQSYAWNRKLVDHIEIVRSVSAQK